MSITHEIRNDAVLDDDAIAALLREMTFAQWPVSDPAWQKRRVAVAGDGAVSGWRRWFVSRQKSPATRTSREVRAEYEQVWTKRYPDLASASGRTHVVWKDEVYQIGKFGLNRFYIALVSALLEKLKPRTVLDFGCGFGLNTLILAAMHPSIAFVGLELTWNGLARAREVQRGALPENFKRFAPGPIADLEGHRRVRWIQADASRAPIRDRAFDTVISVLALEQMESIRPAVLGELQRVTAGSYVGIEPFADCNRAPDRLAYLSAQSYWQGSVSDFEANGFVVRALTEAFPQKPRFGVGLAWMERRS